MAIINQSNILNLQPGITAPVVVHMSEGDVGTKLSFKLIDGARAWTDPGNVVAAVHGRRQDGTQFGPYACAIFQDVVSFEAGAAMAGAAGSGIAQIVLTDSNGNSAGSANFAIMVERATFPMGVTYTNDASVYEAILAYAQTVPAQLSEDFSVKLDAEAAARMAADETLETSTSQMQEELTKEIATRTEQDIVLSARMDQFTKLPDGSLSTAADAELADVRIKANGQTAPTAGDSVREQITQLKLDATDILSGNQNFHYVANWQNGGLSFNTDHTEVVLNPNQNYRVTSLDKISFDRDVVLEIASDFRIVLLTFTEGMYHDQGWKTGSVIIPRRTPFNIVIARTTDITSVTADIAEFTSKVTIKTAGSSEWDELHDKLDDVTEHSRNLLEPFQTLNLYINGSNKLVFTDALCAVWIKCKPNTTYTVSKPAGTRFSVATTKAFPTDNLQVYDRGNNYTGATITITTSADAEYLVAWIYNATDSITFEQTLAATQIEEGSTATAYTVPFTAIDSVAREVADDLEITSVRDICGMFEGRLALSHGGLPARHAYENSPAAFKDARRMGIFYNDIDVTFTRDYVPIVVHDSAVTPVGGTDPVVFREITYEELQAYDFGDADYSWKIQTLAEAYETNLEIGCKIGVDIGYLTGGAMPRLLTYMRNNGIKPIYLVSSELTTFNKFVESEAYDFPLGMVFANADSAQYVEDKLTALLNMQTAQKLPKAWAFFRHEMIENESAPYYNRVAELLNAGISIEFYSFNTLQEIQNAIIPPFVSAWGGDHYNVNYERYKYVMGL